MTFDEDRNHPGPSRLTIRALLQCAGLAYAAGADSAGHELRFIDVARQPFDLLRSKEDFEDNTPPLSLKDAQEAISWAEHLVIVSPLWLGSMPAILKGFFEQVFRPGFAFLQAGGGTGDMSGARWTKRLKGGSARIVVRDAFD